MPKILLILLFFSVSSTFASIAPVEFKTSVTLVGFTVDEEAKVGRALDLVKRVLTSPEFKERLLAYTFKGKIGFNDHSGLSPEAIYQKILDASESLNPGKDNCMNLELEIYHEANKTIGYTYPNVTRIWVNRKYFSRYSDVQVADNLVHEWMHKIGFEHSVKWDEDRKHSVPYAVGYLVEELARKLDVPTLSNSRAI